MSPLPETILLGPDEEASRLWSGAEAARERANEDFVALAETLQLGLRATEILVLQRLQTVRDRFAATIAAQLETPDPDIDPLRDGGTDHRALQFTDALDLMSQESLDCVSPRLHRGWEDRRFSCRRSRATARDALGLALTLPERDDLLLLAAYRNRLFREPPPVRIRCAQVLEAFESLRSLVERLRPDG